MFTIIATIFLIFCVLSYFASPARSLTRVTSEIDGSINYVRDNDREAAEMIAKLKRKFKKFVKYLKIKYPENRNVLRLASRFSPDNIIENAKDTGYVSYTMNKGQHIALCLRSRDNFKKFYNNENVLVYVLLHELTHVMEEKYNPKHEADFGDLMSFLVNEAALFGVYKPVDFSRNPVQYCGITINNNLEKL
jgi:predicted metal-dependent hydrolase